ncbi:sigma factor-like helix-turn-helix DNA-binding protein [Streptomyces sp. NPDC060187]|uniref:sigma factor-like helix-turn-helix DNA-binding protein n=1 Tax=Streptomyces sp. NPDC060187 TaxID=3347067 RepID=UPI0036688E11
MEQVNTVPIADLVDERRHLLDVTYWMLGSAGQAEKAVDETYRRWYNLTERVRLQISDPRSWLAKTAGGICLEQLAQPDRIGTGVLGRRRCPPNNREVEAALEDEVSRVLLTALDSLSPAERAAFVLNDVFGMPPRTVAGIVGRSEPECAELADRARDCLRVHRSRRTTPEQHDATVQALLRALTAEEQDVVTALLCPDVTAFFDGGGKVRALAKPVHGNRRVADSLLTLLGGRPRTSITTHSVNGRTGLVVRYDQQVAAVISLDIADNHVAQVWVVLNPDKLHMWNQTDGRH